MHRSRVACRAGGLRPPLAARGDAYAHHDPDDRAYAGADAESQRGPRRDPWYDNTNADADGFCGQPVGPRRRIPGLGC